MRWADPSSSSLFPSRGYSVPSSGADPSAGAFGSHSGGALFTSNSATPEFAGDASMLAAAALAFSGDGLAPTFSAFLQHPAGKQLVQPSAAVSRLDEFFQRLNPFWQCEIGNLNHRLQHLRDVFHVNVSIFQPRRRAMREELHQQKISFIAVGIRALCFL